MSGMKRRRTDWPPEPDPAMTVIVWVVGAVLGWLGLALVLLVRWLTA